MSSNGKRKATKAARKTAMAAERKVQRQQRAAAIRAKYGPKRKSAPVIVRDLETGEVKAVKSNRAITGQRFPAHAERKAYRGPAK